MSNAVRVDRNVKGGRAMRHVIGPILGILGILAIMGLVAGIAYSAGLGAVGVVVAPGATTTVVPAVAYGWYGVPFFGFGHFLVFLFVFVLFIALLRLAFGGGRRRHGYGWGPSHGWGPGSGGPGGSDDPREAWIRSRLDEWHRTAHATGDAPTVPKAPDAGPASGSGQPPLAG